MNADIYTRSSYNYDIPDHLIAQSPSELRDQSRLLQRTAKGDITHHHFQDLVEILAEDTLIIMNNTKVYQARIFGNVDTGAKAELLLLEYDSNSDEWKCLGKPVKKLKIGRTILFQEGLIAEVTELPTHSKELAPFKVKFNLGHDELHLWLERHGIIPLPPYIRRPRDGDAMRSEDQRRYQTVYAEHRGSVAAPTAGLHFTKDLLRKLEQKNIHIAYTTLHVGAGTFLPVKSDDIREHKMHTEHYLVPSETLKKINTALTTKQKIVCVGTTSLRCLESFYLESEQRGCPMNHLTDTWHQTNLFIYPNEDDIPYKPWAIDGLLTNFHQPESSLLMLVSALIGSKEVKTLYQNAIDENYRLFSYGDASLLWLPK